MKNNGKCPGCGTEKQWKTSLFGGGYWYCPRCSGEIGGSSDNLKNTPKKKKGFF